MSCARPPAIAAPRRTWKHLRHRPHARAAWWSSPCETIALALYVRGELAGVLAACFPVTAVAGLADHRETLSAVATLGASALETVRDIERLQTENAALLERIGAGESGIVGDSAAIRKLLQMIARLAPQHTTVLVLGESGTGKELVARAIHERSPRAPAAVRGDQLRGADRDAAGERAVRPREGRLHRRQWREKKGCSRWRDGGTLFLDEIGETAAAACRPSCCACCRSASSSAWAAPGPSRSTCASSPPPTATWRPRCGAAHFREDLFYRLNVVALRLPPLRDAARGHSRCWPHTSWPARRGGMPHGGLSDFTAEALDAAVQYPWPGNVRELENAIERAVVLGESDSVLPEDLPESILDSATVPAVPGALQSSMVEAKRQRILTAWNEAGGDHNQAATLLNIHPNSLRRLIRILNLRDVL